MAIVANLQKSSVNLQAVCVERAVKSQKLSDRWKHLPPTSFPSMHIFHLPSEDTFPLTFSVCIWIMKRFILPSVESMFDRSLKHKIIFKQVFCRSVETLTHWAAIVTLTVLKMCMEQGKIYNYIKNGKHFSLLIFHKNILYLCNTLALSI